MVRPRKWLLLLGLVLVAINRVAGLTLPFVSRPFVNLVLRQHQGGRLMPLVIAVFVATFIQAITSFSNTQLLSKAAQRMIAELRQQVQRHVGRLAVSFYDENRTGLLVSRIMSDVEGVRNLIGTGLVEFVGGLLTAVMAFVFLMHRSPRMTLIVFAVIGVFVFILQYAFKTIRPIFRERAKITGEVTGRLTESLGGVRVIKGYHAEEREAGVFRLGVLRLLDNVMQLADGDESDVDGGDHGAGHCGRAGHAAQRPSGLAEPDGRRHLHPIHHVSGVHDCAGDSGGEYRHATD